MIWWWWSAPSLEEEGCQQLKLLQKAKTKNDARKVLGRETLCILQQKMEGQKKLVKVLPVAALWTLLPVYL